MSHPTDVGLYIHIPFCRRRCHFCAFYLEITQSDSLAQFHSALIQEMTLYSQHGTLQGRTLRSIYFGGGTPTSLPADQLAGLLKLIQTTWPTSPTVEVTVEAHPATVTVEDLTVLAEAGFNRISFGAESMTDEDFSSIGRFGKVQDTEIAVRSARAAGFANINLDLMYGLPRQSLESWRHTVQSLLTLDPTHISCYALTIEDGTKLAQDVAKKLVSPADEALQLEMESVTEQLLVDSGFVRYEISNYAKPGWACHHNELYWTDGDYLGFGPSAQSYLDGARFGNIADLTAYVERLNDARLPTTDHVQLSTAERQRDALVFGLRLLHGVPLTTMHGAERQKQVKELVNKGLLVADQDRVRLSALGRQLADTVAEQLF